MKRNVMISGEFTMTELENKATDNGKKTAVKTAAARIAALKAAGIDTSNYFSLGEQMVVKVVDGVPVEVTDDDPVFNKIKTGGYISHYKLFRRWVMAQMFRILREMEERNLSFNKVLQGFGYEYQWRMVENEFLAQMKMFRHGDTSCLKQRKLFFDGKTLADMIDDYIDKLKAYIEDNLMYRTDKHGVRRPKHTCKGMPYVRLNNVNIFVDDLNTKVYRPFREMASIATHTTNPEELYKIVAAFNRKHRHLCHITKHSSAFINAYKGAGAYFTMRNLIMFHGARFLGMSESRSLEHVDAKANAYREEGWRMMGVLKQLIAVSHISIEAKIKEWE